MKTTFTQIDYVKAVRKASREQEIAEHGKQISTRPERIVMSKKIYVRCRVKNSFD